ncbi:RcnB family protein [Pseudomonas sp. GD03858]|uniref:anti-virulence regulator CigR family protein n=1 Tax=unclassified Pseudomonas TaxID=196821 RepID=UPI00244BC964|nr:MULTISPECIES: anti-virulence regulator CigR family protein [unclassified Pseudomonas]MDH0649584.1 RcnB family protein [Pseudomonas sp. GD03867]MDH0665099.1 RcnB family protein [Pseudomonas sp. GD03858]
MNIKSRCAVALVLLIGTCPALMADPGKGKGHDKGNPHGEQARPGDGNGRHSGPSIDLGGVRVILNDNRDYWHSGASLPPGIQKNLARGKPLPPGIAKQLDSRLIGRLPHYDGYEWRQAGTDLILVTLATGVIYEVLRNVLD